MRLLRMIEIADGDSLLVGAEGPADAPDPSAGESLITDRDGWRARAAKHREQGEGRPLWLLARDIAEAREAGENAVGAVFELPENADHAADWTAAFEAGLASGEARAAAGSINTRCAVSLALPAEGPEAVGLLERLRQAGVTDAIVRGEAADDAEYLRELAREFDDEEVREATSRRADRMAPLVEAIEARGPREAAADASAMAKQPGRFAERVQRGQEAMVRRMSDRQLGALIGNSFGVRALMRAMAARYRPEHGNGFAGSIEFTLHTTRGPAVWTIDCDRTGAAARRGGDDAAALHVEAELADFLRIGTGEIAAPAAVLSGKLNVRGDFALALRMGEMFGGPSIA